MKTQNIKKGWWIHILIIASLILLTLSTNVQAECRLLGMIAKDNNYLHTESDMVEELLDTLQAQGGDTYQYDDGWGLLYYKFNHLIVDTNNIYRDSLEAYENSYYDTVQTYFINPFRGAYLGMGHVRLAGPGQPSDLRDPHPFVWTFDDTLGDYAYRFTFAHNGTLKKSDLITIADSTFLHWCWEYEIEPQIFGDPPQGYDWWEPEVYADHVVDTEIYFFLVMWRIYLNDGDILTGMHEALNLISGFTQYPNPNTAKNFIFSTNTGLYAYREVEAGSPITYELYYFNDTGCNIFGVMSDPPGNNEEWTYINDGTLVYLPLFISSISSS
ncbi:MAG: class II glutamine amidotransferase [Candidatus Cloacimonetes bacterium]|nr:class II glutamine amidotransferase [Candidatus Cloacimonadota bacterium]MBL7086719.1 class II glutamine amidotransferase [Candidatus Cloacimonadota bacterium]